MFINGKIKIQIDKDGDSQLFETMNCNSCRSAIECDSAAKCKLYNYLKQRLPNSSIDANNVITIKADDLNKTEMIIRRAIRLRKHRIR